MNNHASFIHPAGWPFIAIAAGIFLGCALIGGMAFLVGVVLLAWVIYFFRNPKRVTPVRPGLVISPADGRVCLITEVVPDEELGLGSEKRLRISIFLSIFNVHINRCPIEGTVVDKIYRPGKFFNASLDKASVDNERNALALTMTGEHPFKGQKIGVVQIAGLIARRIVCWSSIGDTLRSGERFGLIRFGSRTDLYLPQGMQPMVCVGQTVLGGETVLADALSQENVREGEVR